MIHELKCWPEYFQAVKSGEKPFEVRKWERPYRVGDYLLLREYDNLKLNYTGDSIKREITYLLDMTYLPGDNIPHFAGYVVMGLKCEPCRAEVKGTMEDMAVVRWNRRTQTNNEPLTLQELREMNDEPVWIIEYPQWGHWELSDDADDYINDRHEEFYNMKYNDPHGRYGLHAMGWLAYRHKPQERL